MQSRDSVEKKPPTMRPGGLEEAVLRAVLHLDGQGYGVNIKKEVEEAMDKSLTYGGIYTTLDRLEAKGLVTSSWGEPSKERGGRPKQFFRITAQGQTALNDAEAAIRRMQRALPVNRPALEGMG